MNSLKHHSCSCPDKETGGPSRFLFPPPSISHQKLRSSSSILPRWTSFLPNSFPGLQAESIAILEVSPFPGLWIIIQYWQAAAVWIRFGLKLGGLYKLLLICLYQEVLRGCLEHGGCHGDIKRPITRPHLLKGSVVRMDVSWEQL